MNELTTTPERPLWTVRQLKLLVEYAELKRHDHLELSWDRAKFPPCGCACHGEHLQRIDSHPQRCICNGGTGFTEL